MKKINFIILLVAVCFAFSSCVTKADIEVLELEITALEDELTDTEEEIEELNSELDALNSELSELSDEKEAVSLAFAEKTTQAQELMNEIPSPPFPFVFEEFDYYITTYIEEYSAYPEYGEKFSNEAEAIELDDGIYNLLITVAGDTETDSFVTLSLVFNPESYEMWEVSCEYKGESNKEEYDILTSLIVESLLYFIDDSAIDYSDLPAYAQTVINDGSFFEGFYKIDIEATDDGEIMTIYATNIR